MRKALAIAAIVFAGLVSSTVPAQAHYDPWNTHWHYVDGQPTYKMCGWWDNMWGCKTEWASAPVVRY